MLDQDSLVFQDLSGFKSETFIHIGYIFSSLPATAS